MVTSSIFQSKPELILSTAMEKRPDIHSKMYIGLLKILKQLILIGLCIHIFPVMMKLSTHLPLVPYICVNEQWSALVQVMVCRLIDAKPLPDPVVTYCQLNKVQWNLIKIQKKIIHENAYEYVVCEMAGGMS